tara:strand:+ start:482 stop:862 length:381 start_codon:yes stop_codon:yes gene_type:complete
MPISGRRQEIDVCIADLVTALNAANITTVASCCGHGRQHGSIVLEDGRELVIREFEPEIEAILKMSDDEILEQAARDGIDTEAVAADVKAIWEKVKAACCNCPHEAKPCNALQVDCPNAVMPEGEG